MPGTGLSVPRHIAEPLADRQKEIRQEVLSHLTKREQEIVRLYYWEDRPSKEIAQTLGLTVGNVIKIRQRATKKLGKLLDVERKVGIDENK